MPSLPSSSSPLETITTPTSSNLEEMKETTHALSPTPSTLQASSTTTPQTTTTSTKQAPFPLTTSGFEKTFKTQILRPLTNNENFILPLLHLRPIFQNILLSTTPQQQQQQQSQESETIQLYDDTILDLLRHKYIPQVIQYCLNYTGSNDEEIVWISHILQSFMEVSVIWMREHGLDYLGGDWWDVLYKCIGDGYYDDICIVAENNVTAGVGGSRKNSVLPRFYDSVYYSNVYEPPTYPLVQPHHHQHQQQQQSQSHTEQVETSCTNTTMSPTTNTAPTNESASTIDLSSYADSVSVHCLYCIRTFYEYDGVQVVTDQLSYASISSMQFVLPFMKSVLNFIERSPSSSSNELSFLKAYKHYLESLDLLQEYNRKFYFPTLDTAMFLTLEEKRHFIFQGIYLCLCEGNSTLQSKIAALGEIKNRVVDALNHVNEARRRMEESLECDDVVVALETPTKSKGEEKEEERIVSFPNEDGVVAWRRRHHPTRIVEETPNNRKKDGPEIEEVCTNSNAISLPIVAPTNIELYPQLSPSPTISPQQQQQQITPQTTPKSSIEAATPLNNINNNNSDEEDNSSTAAFAASSSHDEMSQHNDDEEDMECNVFYNDDMNIMEEEEEEENRFEYETQNNTATKKVHATPTKSPSATTPSVNNPSEEETDYANATSNLSSLLHFLTHNELLSKVLSSPHPEILKRCIIIPSFLADQNELSTSDIQFIWNAAMSTANHESIQHALYDLLLQLLPKLNMELLYYVHGCLKSLEALCFKSSLLIYHFCKIMMDHYFTKDKDIKDDEVMTLPPMGIDVLTNIIFYKEEEKSVHEIGMSNLLSLCSHFILSGSSSNNVNSVVASNTSNMNHSSPNSKKWILDIIFQDDTYDQTNIPQHLVLHNLLRYIDLEEGIHYIQSYNLVQRIVQDLCRYCQKAKDNTTANPVDGSLILVGKYYSHAVVITSSLELLKFVLNLWFQYKAKEDEGLLYDATTMSSAQSNKSFNANPVVIIDNGESSLTTTGSSSTEECILRKEDIELLWTNLVERGATTQETDLCLSAFHSILDSTKSCPTIQKFLAPILFDYCMTRLDLSHIRLPAFDLFSTSMIYMNIIQGIYEPFVGTSASTAHHSYQLNSFDILGLEKLWQIALNVPQEDVAQEALTNLSSLFEFTSIKSSLQTNIPQQQCCFIQTCMNVIHVSNDITILIRCLRLITLFVQEIFNKSNNSSGVRGNGSGVSNVFVSNSRLHTLSHGYAIAPLLKQQQQQRNNNTGNNSNNAQFSLRIQPIGLSQFEVKCNNGSTVSYLRQCIRECCTMLNITTSSPPGIQEYRLIFRGRELTPDYNSTLLTSLGIIEDAVVHCCPRMNTFGVTGGTGGADKNLSGEDTTNTINSQCDTVTPFTDENNSTPLDPPLHMAIQELVKTENISKFFSIFQATLSPSTDSLILHTYVWNLLQLLPTHTKTKYDLKMTCSLEEYLPKNNIPKLLYGLQVLDGLLCTSELNFVVEADDLQGKSAQIGNSAVQHTQGYKHVFIQKGGYPLLLSILLSFSYKGETITSTTIQNRQYDLELLFLLRCSCRLLRFIKYFLEEENNDVEQLKKDGDDCLLEHVWKMLHWCVSIQTTYCEHGRNTNPCNLTGHATQLQQHHHNSNEFNSAAYFTTTDLHPTQFQSATSFHDNSQSLMTNNAANNNSATNRLLLMEDHNHLYNNSDSSSLVQLGDVITSATNNATNNSGSTSQQQNQQQLSVLAQDICSECLSLSKQCLYFIRCSVMKLDNVDVQLKKLFPFQKEELDSRSIVSQAIASSLVVSPSDEIRSLALSTYRSIFSPILKSMSSSSSSVLFHVIVQLLHLGLEHKFMERCCSLFYLIGDLLVDIWSSANNQEKIAVLEEMKNVTITQEATSSSSPTPPPPFQNIHSLPSLLHWVTVQIIILPIREKRRHDHPVDNYLVGLLQLMDKMIILFQDEHTTKQMGDLLVPYLFQSLFTIPTASNNGLYAPPKVKSKASRDATIHLLLTLSDHPLIFRSLLDSLLDQHFTIIEPRQDLAAEWNFDPQSKDKGITNHVGIRNLGATCYLNSLLQQFFLIAPLRYGVFDCRPSPCVPAISSDAQVKKEENLVFQLQLLFANLLLSEKRDYDPTYLCECIQGYDGNSIRPGEQQDVDEFFNLFSDRLETLIKSAPQKNLLQDIFGGKICHIVTCQMCKNASERYESFLSLSLDVKHKTSILESLKLYIQGETLDGDNKYHCSSCQSKQKSIKKCCISTLPNTLILHLKRFEFDLELMRKVKVNDRVEFPLQLEMKPYTKEDIFRDDTKNDDEGNENNMNNYYQYKLRGVLVHSGTADSGHYYSLARDVHSTIHREKEETVSSQNSSTDEELSDWFCFNDSCVTPFDPSTLPTATFGGTKATSKYDNLTQKTIKSETLKNYSAYLLIYERSHISLREQKATESDKQEEEKMSEKVEDRTEDNKLWHPPYHNDAPDPSQIVPKDIYDLIWKQNDRFLKDQFFFSLEYCNFILDLSSKLQHKKNNHHCSPSLLPLIQVYTYYFFEILIHAKDRRIQCEAFLSKLCLWYAMSIEACEWFLATSTKRCSFWSEKVLCHCPMVDVRRYFVKLLTVIFQTVCEDQRKIYLAEQTCDGVADVISTPSKKFIMEQEDSPTITTSTDIPVPLSCNKMQAGSTIPIVMDCSPSPSVLASEEDESMEEVPAQDEDDDILLLSPTNKVIKRLGRVKWYKSESVLAKCVGSLLLDLLPNCEVHWRRFDQLFECLCAFASCGHEEALYLIRCGVLLRLIDIYLGDAGGVPHKSLLANPNIKQDQELETQQQQKKNSRRTKMGDKYAKPNLYFMLMLLDVLIRSAIVLPEDDEEDDDDEDSAAEVCCTDDNANSSSISPVPSLSETQAQSNTTPTSPKATSTSTVTLLPLTLTPNAKASFKSQPFRYTLPRRDAALISTKKFLQTLLEEQPKRIPYDNTTISSNATNISSYSRGGIITSPLYNNKKNASSCFPPFVTIVKHIVCHICHDNLEASKLLTNICQRFFEDRKADEFTLALKALLSILYVNDKFIFQRTELVIVTLVVGITSNLKYEKECSVILVGLATFLSERTRGKQGTKAEVKIHSWMMDNLGHQFMDQWFRRPSTSPEVRQSIISVMKSLLPLEEKKEQVVNAAGTVSCDEVEVIHIVDNSNEVLANMPKRKRNSPSQYINTSPNNSNTNNQDEEVVFSSKEKFSRSAYNTPTSKILSSPVKVVSWQQSSVQQPVLDTIDDNDDVFVLGTVNSNQQQSDGNSNSVKHNGYAPATTSPTPVLFDCRPNQQYNDKTSVTILSPILVPYYDAKQVKELLFTHLIGIFPDICEALKTQALLGSCNKSTSHTTRHHNPTALPATNNHYQHHNHNAVVTSSSSGIVDTTIYSEYFEALRLCLNGAKYEEKLLLHRHHGIHRQLASLLWKIDEEGRAEQRPSADIAKGELIILYASIMKYHPDAGNELLNNFGINTSSGVDGNERVVLDEPDVDMTSNDDPIDTCVVVETSKDSNDDSSSNGDVDTIQPSGMQPQQPRKKLKRNRDGILPQNNSKYPAPSTPVGEAENEDDGIDHVSKLLEIYVTSMRCNESYNFEYMSHYYRLLVLLADRYEDFRRKLLDHNNWTWSLRAFVLGNTGRDSGPLYDVLFTEALRLIDDDFKFSSNLLTYIITESLDGGKRSLITQSRIETSTFKFLIKIFESGSRQCSGEDVNLVTTFVDKQYRGLSQLSDAVYKCHKKFTEETTTSGTAVNHEGSVANNSSTKKINNNQNRSASPYLEGLALSLECICIVLNTFGMNQLRTLMSIWPEVDDMNFNCTQIVTYEWENLITKESVKDRIESMRVVEHASELLKILASIEAVAEVEAE